MSLFPKHSSAPWIAVALAAAVGAAFACGRQADVHESGDAKTSPCISCHSGAYTAARNPIHVDRLPQTCQNCHNTKAWVPTTVTDHPWFPLQNKHAGVSCGSCHTKGYGAGDTPKDCVGCHRKDYDAAQTPRHAVGGVDVYPLDCAMCHNDSGFKPSTFQHPWPLLGRHVFTPCTSCHTGTPPTYKGTTTDCYTCHQADFDTRAPAANPNHPTFPKTCLNCHLMSGWVQGPPLSGLHPESSFPITSGKHADPGIACLDCHMLEKGPAQGGSNTDCIHCHLGSHTTPAIDAYHLKTPDGGTVPGYPQGAATTNFCLGCHSKGQHL